MFETHIKIKQAAKKIKFTDFRLKQFYNWDAPKEYQYLKDRCISILHERIIFLKEHAVPSDFNNI